MGVLNRKRPPPDLAAMVKAAVSEALGQQAKPAHQPAQSKPPRLAGVLRALNTAPLPAPTPATPPPARQPPRLTSVSLQRDSNGKIAAVSVAASNGSRHHLVAQRDDLGRMRSIVIDDQTTWRVERGYNDQIAGLTPMENDK